MKRIHCRGCGRWLFTIDDHDLPTGGFNHGLLVEIDPFGPEGSSQLSRFAVHCRCGAARRWSADASGS